MYFILLFLPFSAFTPHVIHPQRLHKLGTSSWSIGLHQSVSKLKLKLKQNNNDYRPCTTTSPDQDSNSQPKTENPAIMFLHAVATPTHWLRAAKSSKSTSSDFATLDPIRILFHDWRLFSLLFRSNPWYPGASCFMLHASSFFLSRTY